MNRPSIRRQWEKTCAELIIVTKKHEDLRDNICDEIHCLIQERKILDTRIIRWQNFLEETE